MATGVDVKGALELGKHVHEVRAVEFVKLEFMSVISCILCGPIALKQNPGFPVS